MKAKREGRPLVVRKDMHGETLTEIVLEAAHTYSNFDDQDDEGFERAKANLLSSSRRLGRSSYSEAVQEGLAAARARGVRLGRPPAVEREAVAAAVKKHGSIRKAAQALGVSLMAAWRAMRRRV